MNYVSHIHSLIGGHLGRLYFGITMKEVCIGVLLCICFTCLVHVVYLI